MTEQAGDAFAQYVIKKGLPPNPKQAYGDKKINLALVPPASIAYEALAFMEGARKYGPFNWRDKAVEAMTYIAASMRHIGQWQDGEEIDEPSGKPHLGMAKACLGILIDAMTTGNLIDNRPKPGAMTTVLTQHEKPSVQARPTCACVFDANGTTYDCHGADDCHMERDRALGPRVDMDHAVRTGVVRCGECHGHIGNHGCACVKAAASR